MGEPLTPTNHTQTEVRGSSVCQMWPTRHLLGGKNQNYDFGEANLQIDAGDKDKPYTRSNWCGHCSCGDPSRHLFQNTQRIELRHDLLVLPGSSVPLSRHPRKHPLRVPPALTPSRWPWVFAPGLAPLRPIRAPWAMAQSSPTMGS